MSMMHLIGFRVCSKDMEVESTAPAAPTEEEQKGEMMEEVGKEEDSEELKAALAMSMEVEDAGEG